MIDLTETYATLIILGIVFGAILTPVFFCILFWTKFKNLEQKCTMLQSQINQQNIVRRQLSERDEDETRDNSNEIFGSTCDLKLDGGI